MNVVWSKENCAFCVKAKQLLKSKGIEFEERVIGSAWTKEQLLQQVPDARTVPQIIIEGKLVGGFIELQKYFSIRE
jgi:glutaredoxin